MDLGHILKNLYMLINALQLSLSRFSRAIIALKLFSGMFGNVFNKVIYFSATLNEIHYLVLTLDKINLHLCCISHIPRILLESL